MPVTQRLVVGLGGAAGILYGIRLLEGLHARGVETHLVVSRAAERAVAEETVYALAEVKALAAAVHPLADIGASIASGSFRTLGMVVAPCSMETMAAIGHSRSDDLLTRAADVTLKEGRKLVLVVCEEPVHPGQVASVRAAAECGAVIVSPDLPAGGGGGGVDDVIAHTVGRALAHLGL
jgi:4-hydroxy-3-polyprenylbenzoate decarboxylase